MAGRATFSTARRLETWLRTGPVGHLLGGAADFSLVLGRALLARFAPRQDSRGARRPR